MITIAPLDGFKGGGGGGRYYAEVTLSSHPHIEASVMRAITDTVVEWRRHLLGGRCPPLDSNSIAAQNLITIFDFFLSYGYVYIYWVYARTWGSDDKFIHVQ